jgi:hypothetical protein
LSKKLKLKKLFGSINKNSLKKIPIKGKKKKLLEFIVDNNNNNLIIIFCNFGRKYGSIFKNISAKKIKIT